MEVSVIRQRDGGMGALVLSCAVGQPASGLAPYHLSGGSAFPVLFELVLVSLVLPRKLVLSTLVA